MSATQERADLVLSGGGVLGIGHVGAVTVLAERGYAFERIAGTSAGSIVGALLAAGTPGGELRELITSLDYRRFLDKGLLDRIPVIGGPLSVLLEHGYAEGRYFSDWLTAQLAKRGVHTFGDLRIRADRRADPRPEQRWKLVVVAADITQGEMLRLPWDYQRYGLDPDAQSVADAVRASISVPYLFEPARLRHAGGESVLVDGGLVSNYPIDIFDRTDARRPRWPTFGITLLGQLPAASVDLVPPLRALRSAPSFRHLEALVTTAVLGRDQGYLAQPWVKARSIHVPSVRVDPFDFAIEDDAAEQLYESGRAAASGFLDQWSFEAYLERFRQDDGG